MTAPTHAVQISFFLDPQHRGPEEILTDWWPLVVGAEMVAQAGARVTVIQACHESRMLRRHGVDYHFVAPRRGAARITTTPEFIRLLHELAPDIVHVHGLGFAREVSAMRAIVPGVPVFLQDHADRVPRMWRRARLRKSLAGLAGVSFCALEQADPFIRAALLPVPAPHAEPEIFEIPEITSAFAAGDRTAARRATGVHGNPAVLWVGHLDANKDPLTVLRGIRAALDRLPGLHLWCCYGSAPMQSAVRTMLAGEPQFGARVHLLGHVEHPRIELLMQAADLFVLGSHREGSGTALIEAMATGLVPVVTDIPSFRSLTGHAHVGALWRVGDHRDLCDALIASAGRNAAREKQRVLEHFAAELSPRAVGAKFLAAYRRMITGGSNAVAHVDPLSESDAQRQPLA